MFLPSVHCKRRFSWIKSCALISFLPHCDIGGAVVEEFYAGRLGHEVLRGGQPATPSDVVSEAEQLSLRGDKSGMHIPYRDNTQ